MWRGFVGSCWLCSGCLILHADTRENPVGKNGVMTVVNIVYFPPFFPCNLGVKIPTGVGGLGKAFNSTKPHVNPRGIGPARFPTFF